jgi:aminopeptidase N
VFAASYRWLCLIFLSPLAAPAQPLPEVDLEIALDPGPRSLEAQASVRWSGGRVFEWRLASGLAVSEVSLDGRRVPVDRSDAGGGVTDYRIALGRRPGWHRLTLRYAGTLAATDTGLDHRGTLGELPAMAGPQGSFLPADSHWYPRPEGLFRYSVTVRTPAGQRAIVPGRLEAESSTAAGNRSRFVFAHPAEGIDLMVGPYTVTEREAALEGGKVRVRTYFHEDLAPLAPDYLAAAERFIRRYSEEIGAYPYGEFSIVSSPLPTGFGMPTLTYLGIEVLKLPFIRDVSLGHEILHNWWGNGVYVDPRRGNWSEGLTTFMADYAFREEQSSQPGADRAQEMRLGWLRDYAAIAPGSEKPLAAFTSRTHTASSAVGYGKSAMLFLMLRDELGRSRFMAGVRAFWHEQRFHPATFDDLRSSFEQSARRPLKAFFEQWLVRTGAPRLRLLEARSTAEANGLSRLQLTLDQGSVPYALRVPLRVHAGGTDQDFAPRLRRTRQSFTLPVHGIPTAVQIDPEFTLWRTLTESESPPILRELETATAPLAVLLDDDPAVAAAARKLLERYGEGTPRFGTREDLGTHRGAAVVIGPAPALDQLIATQGLPARPKEVGQGAENAVWVLRGPGGGAILFVALSGDAPARAGGLEMLARRLPHLARYSWLRFDGGKLAGRGTWPAETPWAPVRNPQ